MAGFSFFPIQPMTQTGFLSVKNFERFQHYKDRNPPWIKLHASLLDDYEFGRLHDASKMHLMGIWILASKTDNRIPCDPEWIAKRIGATDPIDVEALVSSGFLEYTPIASKPLASRKQNAPLVEERRVETETEKNGSRKNGKHSREPSWLAPFSDLWTSGAPPYGQLARVLRPLTGTHGEPEVLEHWKRYLSQTDPKFWSPQRFVTTYNLYGADMPTNGLADEPRLEWVDG